MFSKNLVTSFVVANLRIVYENVYFRRDFSYLIVDLYS